MGKIIHQTINSKTDFFYYAFRNILLIGLPLAIICGLVLSHLSLHSSATSSGTDSFTVNISTACSISSTVNSEHFINANIGTYNPNVGKTTITTLCNDGNGYSIYANGYSNNEEGNNKLINSTYPQYSIDTGLATSGLTSTWAMKLNNIENDPSPTPPTIDSNYNNTYGLVPSTWTKVAYRQSGTTDMSEGSSFITTYSVYASSSQYNGTYNGQVKYVLLHPHRNDATIPITNFEDAFALHGKEKVTTGGINNYAMQDMTTEICNSVTTNGETTAIQLVDIRDRKLYWVAKLADGNCWMTQNLDFDIVADEQDPTKMKTLTSEDTDLTDHSLTGAYSQTNGYSYDENTGITSWTPANTAKTINFGGTTVTGWQDSNTVPYSASKTDDTNTEHTSLGNYYNWTAAIASSNSTSISIEYDNAANSICPKSWRLPIATDNNQTIYEFGDLLYDQGITQARVGNPVNYTTDGFNKIRTSPLWFVLSGNIATGSIWGVNDAGYCWSSTVSGSSNAYFMRLDNTGVFLFRNGETTFERKRGFSIRCLAK